MESKDTHGMKGKTNAKKYSEETVPVQVRVPISVKELWKKQAELENLSITSWLIKQTTNHSPE
jgi:hypothetical protein